MNIAKIGGKSARPRTIEVMDFIILAANVKTDGKKGVKMNSKLRKIVEGYNLYLLPMNSLVQIVEILMDFIVFARIAGDYVKKRG